MPIYNLPGKVCLFITLIVFTTGCQNKTTDKNSWPTSLLLMPDGLKQEQVPDPNSEGARLTVLYCSQCHGTPYPSGHSASDWVVIMRRMILLMQKSEYMGSGGGMMGRRNMPMGMMRAKVPTRAEQKEILTYLQAHSLKSIQENELPDISSTIAEEYKNKCSICHALPSPYQHTAEEWPAVVERMRKHMKDQNIAALTDDEANSLTKYLQNAVQNK